jgi:hypothetical protein
MRKKSEFNLKEKGEIISYFAVLVVLFRRLDASPAAS